jgi:hypothetical protein
VEGLGRYNGLEEGGSWGLGNFGKLNCVFWENKIWENKIAILTEILCVISRATSQTNPSTRDLGISI